MVLRHFAWKGRSNEGVIECAVLEVDTSTYHDKARRPDQAVFEGRIQEIDTFSRFSPAVDPRFSYRAEDVVATLERVCAEVGYPRTIRVDQGLEFVSRDLDLWAYTRGVTLDFSRPGKPTDNAFIEAFNERYRKPSASTRTGS